MNLRNTFAGPARSNLDESISTLRFASTTKNIKNKAVINEDAKDALLRRFQQQIEELRQQLASEGEDPDLTDQQTNDKCLSLLPTVWHNWQ